jgi:RNA polymerase sigma factor (TIGR02999 family)
METRDAVTALLEAGPEADDSGRLYALVYDELRGLAHRRLRHERAGHTLSTTDLVHEAYLRLADAPRVAARGRAYFFASAARAMRQVLVDAARRRGRLRRGAGVAPLSLDSGPLSVVLPEDERAADALAADLLDLDAALDRLAERSARAVHVVECRYFGGLSVEETAEALGVSPRTVKGDWALARAWLARALDGRSGTADGVAPSAPE